jgi:hypothetical protein
LKPLDTITTEDVQRLKHQLRAKAPKTVNDALTVLNMLLKTAVEWKVTSMMPCVIRMLKVPKRSRDFYRFDEYDRLIAAAKSIDTTTWVTVLLGGDAGQLEPDSRMPEAARWAPATCWEANITRFGCSSQL